MSYECGQVKSLVNFYAAMVDLIFLNIEHYFVENVKLDWFGAKFLGRNNVTSFLLSKKTSTFHRFTYIEPISRIIFEEKMLKEPTKPVNPNNIIDVQGTSEETDISKMLEKKFIRKRYRLQKDYNKAVLNLQKATITHCMMLDAKKENATNNRGKIDKGESDDFFKPEITSVGNIENTEDTNRLKLEEEMASTIKAIKRECSQGDKSGHAETNTIHYVEAIGEILFSRDTKSKDPWYNKHLWKRSHWVRKCKLLMAYSCVDKDRWEEICTRENTSSNKEDSEITVEMEVPSIEPIFKDIIQHCASREESKTDYFSNYLRPINFAAYREKFLKDFEVFVTKENPDACLPKLRFVGNKPFLKLEINKSGEGHVIKMSDKIYQIHNIIYQNRIDEDDVKTDD